MNSSAPVTEGFSRWLCEQTYERLPSEVREKTIDVVYDTVGCMVACSKLIEVEAIVSTCGAAPVAITKISTVWHRITVQERFYSGGHADVT